MVSFNFSGSFINPGAKTFITEGMKNITKTVVNISIIIIREKDFSANNIACFLPLEFNSLEKIGIKAALKAPSA